MLAPWTTQDKPSPIPSWAPPTYRQCDMATIGGATEEDFYCSVDMGLTQADTTKVRNNVGSEVGQLQPFIAVSPQECLGQLASFGPT
jgi:hypothetical protein